MHVLVLMLLCAGLLTACASWPAPTRSERTGQPGQLGSCADFYAALDLQTAASNAVDAAYERIAGFPYLRIDRFLASFDGEVDDPRKFAAWVDRLQALDRSARRIEINNLPDAALSGMGWADRREELFRCVLGCGDLLKTADFSDAERRDRLRRIAVAADEYIALRRAAGFYPLTKVFVARGVRQWHLEARRAYSTEPPSGWKSIRYSPIAAPSPEAARGIVALAEPDALGIPTYSAEDLNTLFAAYAPVWEVETRTGDDRIGSPFWMQDGRIGVDTNLPAAFTHLSFTRSGRAVLTQLNYIIWFPSRPKTSLLDIYGGLLDGLNFRITLNATGNPMLYETIHNCGCYYEAYPTEALTARETIAYAEPPLILEAPSINPASQTMVVALDSRTHYVRHLYARPRGDDADAVGYVVHDYLSLQSLPLAGGGLRSMFNRYGLVPGTQRLERHLLWPTGVLSPGAMRQWGRHAVAFVGKRHFDDPFYVDRMFKVAGGRPE